jgi:uncharacterized membrane protein
MTEVQARIALVVLAVLIVAVLPILIFGVTVTLQVWLGIVVIAAIVAGGFGFVALVIYLAEKAGWL